MTDIVIQAEGLGKKYTIGHQTERAATSTQRRKAFHILHPPPEEVWALKDVRFEIRRGEAVGEPKALSGRNGAGKSTVLRRRNTWLKVLSRITEPSAGRVTLKGRVASLLEVATGFHPELTGRENIYKNGVILGMR